LTPAEIVEAARESHAHLIGLSVLSGSHVPLVREVMNGLRAAKLDTPVVVGGIIPQADVLILKQLGVVKVYTPKDYEIDRLIGEMIAIIEGRLSESAA
jgi:(2R)-ethylmalonyl-CoA mutase